MKKKLSLLTTFFLLLWAIPLAAQLDELKQKTIVIQEQAEEMVPGTWYLLFQARGSGGYMCDMGAGSLLLKPSTDNVTDGDLATEKAGFLVRFIPTEGASEVPAYHLQFGTGNYVAAESPERRVNGTELSTTASLEDADAWNITLIAESLGHFCMTTDPLGCRIDNNGTGSTISYWDSGAGSDLNANYDWQLFPVELVEVTDLEILYERVLRRYFELQNYYDAFEPGTEPGYYGAAEVEAFLNTMNEAGVLLDTPIQKLTQAQLDQMLEQLNQAYENVVASRVEYVLDNGYYRIRTASNFYYEERDDQVVYPEKGLWGEGSECGWSDLDRTTYRACTFLWRFDRDAQTGNYQVYNVTNGGRFGSLKGADHLQLNPALTPEESEIQVSYVSRDENDPSIIYVALSRADNTDAYGFFHQNKHGNGTGRSGNIVGWDHSGLWSLWSVESVSEEEAQVMLDNYSILSNKDCLLAKFDSLRQEVLRDVALAEDMQVESDRLVTTEEQYSSAMTDDNYPLSNLLDGNNSTFWHSRWDAGPQPGGTHFIQIDFVEPVTDGVAMDYVRRSIDSDQTLEFSLYGYDHEPDLYAEGKETGKLLATVKFPDLIAGKVMSATFSFVGSFQWVRLYSEKTNSANGFWHAAELNFHRVVPNPNAQAAHMGEAYTQLKALLQKQIGIDRETVTPDDYTDLQEAYDLFLTKFVNPADLLNSITQAEAKVTIIAEGTDPGFWPLGTGSNQIEEAIEAAKAYLATGSLKKEEVEAHIQQLKGLTAEIDKKVIQVSTDKWYQIQFPTEEMFDEHEWDKSGAAAAFDSYGNKTAESLYGLVAAPAVLSTDEETGIQEVTPISVQDAHLATGIYFNNPQALQDEELSWFRFVAVGDSAFMLQNKATGLFVRFQNPGQGIAFVDLQPSLVNVRPMGYGANLISVCTLDGASQTNAHVQHNAAQLVTWDAMTPGSNSTMMIHEVAAVTADDAAEASMIVEPGRLYTFCYPVDVEVTDGGQLYSMKGVTAPTADSPVCAVLQPEKRIAAGQPAVFIAEGEYGEEQEPIEAFFKHGASPVAEPLDQNGLVGTFFGTTVEPGMAIAEGPQFTTTLNSVWLGANTAYLAASNIAEPADGDLLIPVSGEYTSVHVVPSTVANGTGVYALSGQLLQRRATPQTLRQLTRGIYIVGGRKFVVK